MDRQQLGRGSWVGFAVHEMGYDVRVYDPESNVVEEYNAGNHDGDSQAYVPRGDPSRLPKQTLRRFARQTAQEMAAEHGINLAMVQEEEDGE